MIKAVKGMRDFYPQDYRQREWLFQIFKDVSLNAGFEFYDAPLVEHEELYTRKAGEEISDQLYNFEDKSGRSLSLRPEMTPSLARMVIQRQKELPGIIKWASIPQCFRYERMTRGRKREHYQWNLDYLGEASMMAEVEIISTALHAIERMGLSSKQLRVRVSNRKLFSELLSSMGVGESLHQGAFLVIDKLGKISDDALVELLVEAGIEKDVGSRILEFSRCDDLQSVQDLLTDSQGLGEIQSLFQHLENYGFGQYLEFDLSVVRGLAYYTGTVFELFDAGKSLRAIAGGGRYDRLIATLAQKESASMPAVGFGFGDVVIQELLKDLDLMPEPGAELDYYLLPFANEDIPALLPILKHLRAANQKAQLHYPPQKLKKALLKAEKLGAKKVLIIGSQERESKEVRIKDLESHQEILMSFEDFLSKDLGNSNS